MTSRGAVLDALVLRAKRSGKRVFGYCSRKADCAEMPKKGIPDDWDRACVEGDEVWAYVPAAEEKAANTEAAA